MRIGDQKENYKAELCHLLVNRYGPQCVDYQEAGLDIEPFEILCNLLSKAFMIQQVEYLKWLKYINIRIHAQLVFIGLIEQMIPLKIEYYQDEEF